MEDQERRLDPDPQEIPQVKGVPLSQKYLTVMIMRSVGKMRSFRISRRLIFWSSIFIIAYLLVSIYFINGYFDLRYRYRIQSKRLESLETDNFRTRKSLFRTKGHVVILEDYIQNMQNPEGKGLSPSQKREGGSEAGKKATEDVYVEDEGSEKPSEWVQIEDFIIEGESSGLSVDFKLVNAKRGDDAMEGYIHIIAMDEKKEPYPEWNYSKDMLKDGLPLNFRRGQPFLIQRFKPYHRTYSKNSNSELPSSIKVLVYDRSGSLLLEKKYNIHEIS